MSTETVVISKRALFSTKEMVIIGMFSALSYVLQLIRLPYSHLGFLEFEFSDVPAVIATLQYGPLAGVLIEFIKNFIKALTASTTGWVGEVANFFIACGFVVPIGLVNRYLFVGKTALPKTEENKRKNHFRMVFMFGTGVAIMSVAGALINYFIMVPIYATFLGGVDKVVAMAAETVPSIKDLAGLVIIGITPFNILKGIVISIVGYYTHHFLRGRVL